ncbi:MAG: CoA ester lyase [Variovorax sp.]|jgi:citrate lyase subunit beta/citryl-CoA lyase|nr:MAG: CoA ester lyase [Variovorax sp.]
MIPNATPAPHAALPGWRSILYVPVNVARFVEKAPRAGADAIQLDLEDSIAPEAKDDARALVRDTARRLAAAGAQVLVRINRPLAMAVRDIEAAVGPDVRALSLTKVASPDHVRLLAEVVDECEARQGLPSGHTRLVVMIETPQAFEAMREIAGASPRIVGMSLGAEDFALECGFTVGEDTLLLPKQMMVIAARAAGVMPIGYLGTVVDFTDEQAFGDMVRRSRNFGFDAATCIHPRQVPIVNRAYGVSPDEAARARRLVDEGARQLAAGRGAFQLDGKMVDAPLVERAKRVLARHEAFGVPA